MSQKIEAELALKTAAFDAAFKRVDGAIIGVRKQALALTAGFAGITAVGVGAFAAVTGAARKLKESFDLGGELSDLSAAMGITAGQVLVMRQAFENAGMGGNAFETSVRLIQKALGGVNEEGKSTEAALARLGITADSLSGLTVDEQMRRIAAGFALIEDPATRTRTAMELFGRSGSKMLVLFSDSAAMETAAAQVGSLGSLMDQNAGRFDAISDSLNTMKLKSDQLWAGFAEQLAPAIEGVAEALSRMDLTGVGAGMARAAQATGDFAGALAGLADKVPMVAAIKGLLDKIGMQTWGDMFEASGVEGLGRRNYGTSRGIDRARESMATETERSALLARINGEMERTEETLAQIADGTHEVFSSYEPERVERVKSELEGHLAVLNAQRAATESVAIAQGEHARATQMSAEAMEKLAEAQAKVDEARKKARTDAVAGLEKWRQDEEIAGAGGVDGERKILMGRSGLGSVSEIDARIDELGKLLALGSASTTMAEAAELDKLTGIRSRVGAIDRGKAKETTADAQKSIDEKAKQAAELMDGKKLPGVQVWADSARQLGLGGRAASNEQEIAKIQAERQREANSLLRDIRELLRKTPGTTAPVGELVFN